jgi:hypothetical protein
MATLVKRFIANRVFVLFHSIKGTSNSITDNPNGLSIVCVARPNDKPFSNHKATQTEQRVGGAVGFIDKFPYYIPLEVL